MLRELDEQHFPPFEGFPDESLLFLKRLKKNNNRDWFHSHKSEYEEYIKFPMQCFIASMQPHFVDFAPQFDIHPKRSMFRIYRDTRFSKDKTPYKTHMAAHFVLRGKPKGFEGSGYYLQIAPGEVFIGGGIYMPDNDQLKKIRKAIAERSKEFLAIINKPSFIKTFPVISGEKLIRPPKGFEPNHPMIEWLKMKQFFTGLDLKDDVCRKKEFSSLIAKYCKELAPLVDFLNSAMGFK
ncbi:MAG: DUF2461 domain-containing protein [Bacteroidota bacterium]